MATCFMPFFVCIGQDKPPAPTYDAHNKAALPNVTKGIVVDALNAAPLIGAHVRVLGPGLGVVSDVDGRFELMYLPAGDHIIEARMIGFSPGRVPLQIGKEGASLDLVIRLEEETLLLAEIVVKPEKHDLDDAEIHGAQSISIDQIDLAAQFDEDIFRTVTRVPGLIATDFSSRFSIRGGGHDEVLVTFDGLELNDPFHLKDFGGGGMSIIDAGVIGSVDVFDANIAPEEITASVFAVTSALISRSSNTASMTSSQSRRCA